LRAILLHYLCALEGDPKSWISELMKNLGALPRGFYYGVFEYPKGSNQWYKGAHNPIIDKTLFDLVKQNITDNSLEKKDKQKEFSFTKLLTCSLCGSGLTADEKFKKLKDGSVNRHVYCKCTKVIDKDCKFGYINEENLIKQLQTIIDTVDLNKLAIKEKIQKEIIRFKRFQNRLLKEKIL
jgi:hypothetical protein